MRRSYGLTTYCGLIPSGVRRLKKLEEEIPRLRKLAAEGPLAC